MCIGGRDPTTLITPNKAMSFKFRSSFRTVTTTQKAPAFKNTASAERFIDHTKAADILANHSVKKYLAEVNFEDHSHSVLKESGVTRGHSVLQNSFSEKLSGRDSILGGAGKQNESQFGEDGLLSAGKFGKGMAGNDGYTDAANCVAVTEAIMTGLKQDCAKNKDLCDDKSYDNLMKLNNECAKERREEAKKIMDKYFSSPEDESTTNGNNNQPAKDPANPAPGAGGRPAPDDNGGSEGGFMTQKMQDQLSNGFKNAKDPIINPSDDNQGGGGLTATELKEMEAEMRKAKDPATNWGDDNYNNFVGTIEMNVGEISRKDPFTNWGDNYTSTTANVVDTVFSVQAVEAF